MLTPDKDIPSLTTHRIQEPWMHVDIILSSSSDLIRDDSERSYVTTVRADLRTTNDNEEGDEFVTIGTLEGWLISIQRLFRDYGDIEDTFDEISQSALESHSVFFSGGRWRTLFAGDIFNSPHYFFIVNEIKIDKERRGKDLGIKLLMNVLNSQTIPSNTIAALFPCPVEDQGISKEAATKKLQKHWKKAGVKSAGRGGWYYTYVGTFNR